MLEIKKYDLPDSLVMSSPGEPVYIWRPDKFYIVLGRACNAESSLHIETILNDKIDILRRPSGGEAVLLSPKMLVFSASKRLPDGASTKQIFSDINRSIIYHLACMGVKDLHSRGISDISIGDRKIIGSSMYLNHGTIFYHAVLNILEDISLISRYLKHPSREPDYRMGRNHDEFVTSLFKEGYRLDFADLEEQISLALKNVFQPGPPQMYIV